MTPAELQILAAALADAYEYRRPPDWCGMCHEGAPCEDCASDAARADSYLKVAARLGLEVEAA